MRSAFRDYVWRLDMVSVYELSSVLAQTKKSEKNTVAPEALTH